MHELKSKSRGVRPRQDNLSELIRRGMLVGIGILLLQADAFRNVFMTILGSVLTVGPIVTVGPIETLLKLSFNKITQKVVGKEVFIVEQRNIKAQTVIGQHFGDIIQPISPEIDENWNIARDFSLSCNEDEWEPTAFRLKAGQRITGYFRADDDVWAHVLTPSGLRTFKREEEGFMSLWDATGTYAKVDFIPERSGTYHFVIANFNPEEDEGYSDDEDEDVESDDYDDEPISVELRLRY